MWSRWLVILQTRGCRRQSTSWFGIYDVVCNRTGLALSVRFQVRVEAEAVGKQACVRLVETLRSADVSLQEQVDAVGYLQDLQYEGEEPLQACFNGQK